MQTSSSGIELRPYHSSDVSRAVEIINTDALQTVGFGRAVVDGAAKVRFTRYIPPNCEQVIAQDGSGLAVGFAYLVDREYSLLYEVGGAVHPAYWGRGVGSLLLDWAEQRANELSRRSPEGYKAVLQANLFENEARSRRLFTRHGFQPMRAWLHFVIDLHTPPPVPVWPAGFELRWMDLDDDWELVGPAMDDAYSDHWGAISPNLFDQFIPDEPEKLPGPGDDLEEDESYSNTPGFCFYAWADGQAAGGILCNARLVERADTGRVGSVFVRRAYRRQGLGRLLMLAAFEAFWQHGYRRIILDTDAESFTDAPRFYEGLGMQVYRRELLYEKLIRPGSEFRRLLRA